MAFLKKTGLFLLAQVFGFSILSLAIVFSFNSVFSKPTNIKHALKESKVYDSIAEKIKNETLSQISKDSSTKVNEKIIKDALNKVITPTLMQQNGDKVIDGTYKWLDGTTETPEFNIDIAGIQKQVTDSISDSAVKHVTTLPACTPEQLKNLQLSTISTDDPFSLQCNFPGLNVEELKTKYNTELNSGDKGDGIASQKEFSSKDIKNEQGQSIFSESKDITKVYKVVQILPIIFGVLAILSGIGLFFWSDTRAKGVRKISIKLLFAGIGLLLIFIGSIVFLEKGLNYIPIDITDLKNAFVSFIKILSKEFNKPLLFFAANFFVFGTAGLIIPKLNKSNKQPKDKKDIPKPPLKDSITPIPNPANIPDVPSAPKVRTKPPRLVQ